MGQVDMEEDMCDRVVNIWRCNNKTHKYEQVYPPPEENENSEKEDDLKSENSSEDSTNE